MGGDHKLKPPVVPDWRIYRVEDVPQLMRVKKRLACYGLHDPWLRNEVWKFTEEYNKYTRFQRFFNYIGGGLKYGAIAGVITAAIEYAFFPLRKAPVYDDEVHH